MIPSWCGSKQAIGIRYKLLLCCFTWASGSDCFHESDVLVEFEPIDGCVQTGNAFKPFPPRFLFDRFPAISAHPEIALGSLSVLTASVLLTGDFDQSHGYLLMFVGIWLMGILEVKRNSTHFFRWRSPVCYLLSSSVFFCLDIFFLEHFLLDSFHMFSCFRHPPPQPSV